MTHPYCNQRISANEASDRFNELLKGKIHNSSSKKRNISKYAATRCARDKFLREQNPILIKIF